MIGKREMQKITITEKEAIKLLNESYIVDYEGNTDRHRINLEKFLISTLEEIQQYREIGTVEECRKAREKLPVAEEAIRKLLCSEYGSSCQFCIHDSDEDAVCCNIGGSGSWCCKNAKWNGRLE